MSKSCSFHYNSFLPYGFLKKKVLLVNNKLALCPFTNLKYLILCHVCILCFSYSSCDMAVVIIFVHNFYPVNNNQFQYRLFSHTMTLNYLALSLTCIFVVNFYLLLPRNLFLKLHLAPFNADTESFESKTGCCVKQREGKHAMYEVTNEGLVYDFVTGVERHKNKPWHSETQPQGDWYKQPDSWVKSQPLLVMAVLHVVPTGQFGHVKSIINK